MIDVATILSAIGNVVAPAIGGLCAIVLWLHKRLEQLEDQQLNQRRSLYGNDENPLSRGVIHEVARLREEVEELKQLVEELDED